MFRVDFTTTTFQYLFTGPDNFAFSSNLFHVCQLPHPGGQEKLPSRVLSFSASFKLRPDPFSLPFLLPTFPLDTPDDDVTVF